ncbi:type I restriction endonuclease subunit R, partial [uncultured Methanofollis sp.]|uniref:type I restriction endonuclease subunit R n=1 Tax=uncultured Methanofollis sp. TaxID=262500 RepID=UPI002623F26B
AWAPWKEDEDDEAASPIADVMDTAMNLLAPATVLDILKNYTLYATDAKNRKIKIVCRHQQYDAGNKIVNRVVDGRIKKGLIWHFQGSGKSFLMVFAAQKLRLHPALRNPTVIVVVDRTDLDTQINATFHTTDIPNTVNAGSREDLRRLLSQDTRKIIITTIHKFAEADGVLNERANIILLCDEAHRTQEGDLGQKMRKALPNAFLFGLTGTPINQVDRNTFRAFGATEDESGYLSIYSPEDAMRDGATLPLHFEPRLIEYHIDREGIDEAFSTLTDSLDEDETRDLIRRASRRSTFVHARERIEKVAEDIVHHFKESVEPNGFKAMIVCYDRQSCVQYKEALDKLLPPEASDIVMTLGRSDPDEWKHRWDRSKEDEEKLLDRYRDPLDPLQFVIVTAKLLTGFDAPILQTMYLDKLMKNHTLLQAICRTNRPYSGKSFGLIMDYIGVFDEVARSLAFDEKRMREIVTNIDSLKDQFPEMLAACLSHFPGVDRGVNGWEGLIAAQQCIPTNEARDAFALDYINLAKLWEAISPDPFLAAYKEDYRWLTQVYESVRPVNCAGRLLWKKLGAKTLEIIHENVHVEGIKDDFDRIVIDEDTVRDLLENRDEHTIKKLEIQIIKRLRKHANNPAFVRLGERLEQIKEQYERGFIDSLEFLKSLIQLARDVVMAEKEVETVEEQQQAKAALTELFEEARTDTTPVIIERIVTDIDAVVRAVRFDGWQQSNPGERDVKRALRGALRKYQLQNDQDLFDRAYEYIRQYY